MINADLGLCAMYNCKWDFVTGLGGRPGLGGAGGHSAFLQVNILRKHLFLWTSPRSHVLFSAEEIGKGTEVL